MTKQPTICLGSTYLALYQVRNILDWWDHKLKPGEADAPLIKLDGQGTPFITGHYDCLAVKVTEDLIEQLRDFATPWTPVSRGSVPFGEHFLIQMEGPLCISLPDRPDDEGGRCWHWNTERNQQLAMVSTGTTVFVRRPRPELILGEVPEETECFTEEGTRLLRLEEDGECIKVLVRSEKKGSSLEAWPKTCPVTLDPPKKG